MSNPDYYLKEYAGTIASIKHDHISSYRIMKRMIDISFVFLSLPIVLLIIVVFIILIKMETSGPAFYVQKRVGLYGRYFKVCKLRSMYVDAEKEGAKWAVENDPRVTKVGSFMRRTRIDELPQVFNIIKGEMSLIGPRPERPMFTEEFEEKYPGFKQRLLVKPGLTGLAQVNGGYNLTPKKKLELDINYIEQQGLKIDIKIFIKTIKIVFSGDGAR
ncbi:sugar transferase [Paucisalibacillus sp. EB02]|uniref:sugar transferase n=1 Tax=Paucisalibacillus sp. EB02 TaxID=1347087 RepID=UPI0006933CCE